MFLLFLRITLFFVFTLWSKTIQPQKQLCKYLISQLNVLHVKPKQKNKSIATLVILTNVITHLRIFWRFIKLILLQYISIFIVATFESIISKLATIYYSI